MASSDPVNSLRRSLSETRLDGADKTEIIDFLSERGSRRKRTLTEKGQNYLASLKENNVSKALKELENVVNDIELTWLDHNSDVLRRNRNELESYRKNLEVLKGELEKVVSTKSQHELIKLCNEQNKQALDLRKHLGERIFELEKDELRSRRSSKVTTRTNSTRKSEKNAKQVNLAKSEVEIKFARLQADIELDIQRKRLQFEELERMKHFELAKAEVRIEEEVISSLDEDLKDLEYADIQTTEDRVREYLSSIPDSDLAKNGSHVRDSSNNAVNNPLDNQNTLTGSHLADSPVRDLSNNAVNYPLDNQNTLTGNVPTGNQNCQTPNGKAQTGNLPTGNQNCQTLNEKAQTGNVPTGNQNCQTPNEKAQPRESPGHPRESSTPCQASNPPFIPSYQTFGSAQDIGSAIAEGIEAARLPTPTLSVFSGNPLEWPTWKAAFETVIERRATNAREKILYLQQYLTGEPKKIVEGYQFVQTAEAYQEAKKTLERRFGHPSVVAEAFRNRLISWPKIAPRDGKALREFGDFLRICQLAMQSVEDLETLNKQHDNKQLLKILPSWMHSKWGSRVRSYQIEHGEAKFPPFDGFVDFVNSTADVQCLPVLTGLEATKPPQREYGKGRTRNSQQRGGASSLSTSMKEHPSRDSRSLECLWCKSSHHLNECREFAKKHIRERTRFIIRKGLCLRCLQHGHMSKENKCKEVTTCVKCKQGHPTCLHVNNSENHANIADKKDGSETAETKCTSVCKLEGQQTGQDQSLILPVWISSEDNPQVEGLTYALIDCQSNATFISESLRSELKIEGVDSHLLLSTMHEENEMIECKKVKGLVVKDFKRQVSIPLPKTFTRPTIPCKPSQIPKPEVAKQWKHLNRIADELMTYRDDIEVGLLIGTNCPKAIKPREVIPGSDNDPYGIRTDLGWGIVGRVCKNPIKGERRSESSISWSNKTITEKVSSDTPEVHNEHDDAIQAATFTTESRAREVISPAQVNQMFERDFHERSDESKKQPLSVDDRRFLKKLDEGIHKREDGHYEMPLPIKFQDMYLPDNRSQALRRLAQLKSRFKRDSKFYSDYVTFMDKVITECAERIPQDAQQVKGRTNYVAHHGVYHPKKPDKIRVVFDCSAVHQGTSLNKNLLQGPDLTNSLQGVLCRFRQEEVAITCDVEGMFHQFYVDEEDRDLLRFFWWKDGDLNTEPVEYRMKVHLFGAASSPGCANFGFKKAADDGEDEFGADAANFIRRDFYVDDGLKSVKTTDEAKQLIQNSIGICAKAGLKLHKFSSNNKEVLLAVPPEDRAKGLQSIDFNTDPLPIERTLGIMWSIETDTFQFRIVVQDRPLTRRGILSTVCSVFDPLGLVAPLVLVGKRILQDLCKDNVDWDEPIGDDMRPRWEQWRNELHTLEYLKIPRCYKPSDFGKVKRTEIHHFSDASQVGYGQCSYLRLINERDQVHCSLVMGKARVTPLKPVTIPRLELTAAVISVKISQSLQQELEYDDAVETFWTDSKVVLGYINNSSRRFHIYVANRVQQIHEHTEPHQWQYVETDSNPADAASRGLTAKQLLENKAWLNGPEFLWKPVVNQASAATEHQMMVNPDDPEIKKTATLSTNTNECNSNHLETSRLNRFSDWHAAKRAVAMCIRYKNLLKKKANVKQSSDADSRNECNYKDCAIHLEELCQAENVIIRSVQQEHFHQEIKILNSLDVKGEFVNRESTRLRNTSLKKCSSLYRLDPYLDDNGVLRVGGRLRRANMSEDLKHPVILPRKAHISKIVINHCHLATKHQGRGMTYNEVRQRGYWIIGGLSATASAIERCVTCKRLRAPLQQQKMADLPNDRLEPAPPFTYCGVDYFGPFVIKEGRKEVKRYGVLFTCMASRAIHIETATSLTTDSFINALRRFLAERGPVRQIRSDCGTNFVGAKNEFFAALDEVKIRNLLLKENCEFITFKMNPPSASHAGGVWERQIRSVRNILQPLLQETGTQLDDECFRTLMKEVQAIINSRPLTATGMMSPDQLEPLTPNHLLTMKSKVLLPPPGVFMKADLYCRKRWRRVQHLANVFWQKWRQEYLQTLQLRKKWTKPVRNMQEGDIVLVKDENLPRNQWKLGRVQQVFPSQDGLVRKVRLVIASAQLDNKGKRLEELKYLDRPIQKLVVLQHTKEDKK